MFTENRVNPAGHFEALSKNANIGKFCKYRFITPQAYEKFDWKRPVLLILVYIRIYQFFKIFVTENFKGVPLHTGSFFKEGWEQGFFR